MLVTMYSHITTSFITRAGPCNHLGNLATLAPRLYLNNLVVDSDVLESEVHSHGDGEVGVKLALAFLFENAGLAYITVTYKYTLYVQSLMSCAKYHPVLINVLAYHVVYNCVQIARALTHA